MDWLFTLHAWTQAEPWRWRILVHFPLALLFEIAGRLSVGKAGGGPLVYGVHEIAQKMGPSSAHSWEWHFLDWLPAPIASVAVTLWWRRRRLPSKTAP